MVSSCLSPETALWNPDVAGFGNMCQVPTRVVAGRLSPTALILQGSHIQSERPMLRLLETQWPLCCAVGKDPPLSPAQPSPASSVNTSRVASVHLNTSLSSVLCGSVSLGAGLSLLLSSDCGWKYRSCLGSCQDNTGKQFSVHQPLTNSRRTLQRIRAHGLNGGIL